VHSFRVKITPSDHLGVIGVVGVGVEGTEEEAAGGGMDGAVRVMTQ